MIPTVETEVIIKDGFHKRVVLRSYAVLLCEIGGSRVKAVRLDRQANIGEAIRTALTDNPGWKLKRADPLNDRDFDGESK